MSDLKPCPFCPDGGEPDEDGSGFVFCNHCKSHGPFGYSIPAAEDAILRWNRRAPRFSPEEREAMEIALGLFGVRGTMSFTHAGRDVQAEAAAILRKMIEEGK